MGLFTLEHSKAAYYADFVLYAAAVILLTGFVILYGPRALRIQIGTFALMGLAIWTIIEYGLRRFVPHGLQPFRRWHEEHHQRPTALICTPTILSAILIVTLAYLPAMLLIDFWRACALTLGLLAGYFVYGVAHHATHHWRTDNAWLKRRKQWHALHHHAVLLPSRYGVTTAFGDQLFSSSANPTKRFGN